MRVVALLLLAALLAPSAAACTFAERPPAPGAFFVWDWAENETASFEVADRALAGDCNLANLHALDGRRFAWLEGTTLRIADLATGAVKERTLDAGRVQAMSLAGGLLIHVSEQGPGIHGRAFTLNLTTGAREPLPVPEEHDRRHLWLSDALVFVVERVGEQDRVSGYDALREEWVHRNLTAKALGLPAHYAFRDGNRAWLHWGWQDEDALYHLPSGELHEAPAYDRDRRLGLRILEGDHLYGSVREPDGNRTLYRMRLPDGELERIGTRPRPFLGTVDGSRAVFGEYSAPWANEESGSVPHEVPSHSVLPALVALSSLAFLLARRPRA